jgi:hypothetical protein
VVGEAALGLDSAPANGFSATGGGAALKDDALGAVCTMVLTIPTNIDQSPTHETLA